MKIVSRHYRQVFPEPPGDLREARPFAAFRDTPALVVIGDPGSGKTTALKELCAEEETSAFTAIADILYMPIPALHKEFDGKTIYLDGLDECRAKAGDSDVVGRILGILIGFGRPKFRLSCRAADWHGGMDVSRLAKVAPDRRLTVLHLDELNEEQIRDAISDDVEDPTEFMDRANRYGVAPLLGNPQTLQMLVSVVRSGSWPSTRFELYDRATRLLSAEVSLWHSRTVMGKFSTDAMLMASGRMYAALLLGAASGFAVSRNEASERFPLVEDVFGDDASCQAATRRRLFASEGGERVGPPHRTVAEYLAARFLVSHVREGFPLSRLIALLTCQDGGVAPELRGVFAWIVSLSPEHSDSLINMDPLAAVLYGDPSVWGHSAKVAALKAFDTLAQVDPWFRAESWSSEPFGGLASADMEPVFADYLRSARERNTAVLSCVLDALQHGEPMPRLGDALLDVAQDNSIADHLREAALAAFLTSCPARRPDLLPVLTGVENGSIKDVDDRLRGSILQALYPSVIAPETVISHISKPNENHYGGYAAFITHSLLDKTPVGAISVLADAVAGAPQRKEIGKSDFWGEFVESVLFRALEQVGDAVPARRLYVWLGMGLDEHGYPSCRRKQSEDVRKWLQDRASRIKELFDIWLSEDHTGRMSGDCRTFFEYRLRNAEPPPDFAPWLLDKARARAADDKMADVLFVLATDIVFFGRGNPNLAFDELSGFVTRNTRFQAIFRSLCQCEIPDWRWKMGDRDREQAETQRREIADGIASLTSRLDQIRAGHDWGALFFLSRCYFRGIDQEVRNLSPLDCIKAETTPEIADAAIAGFKNVMGNPISLTPRDVGRLAAKSKGFCASYVVRAGMRLLADESIDAFQAIPEPNLRLAIAFGLDHCNEAHDKPWMQIVIERRPELVAEVLIEYVRPQLEGRSRDCVGGLAALTYGSGMPGVAQRAVPELLRDYPNAKAQVLRDLLRAALAYCSPNLVLELAKDVLRTYPLITITCLKTINAHANSSNASKLMAVFSNRTSSFR